MKKYILGLMIMMGFVSTIGAEETDLVKKIQEGTNVIFVSAHPDDEIYVASLLGFAADHGRSAVLCATGGESGGNFMSEPSTLTLRQVRTNELEKAAALIGAEAKVFACKNGTSTAHPEGIAVLESGEEAVARWQKSGEGTHTPEEIIERWRGECPEFIPQMREFIAEYSPCIVITFTPDHGITGHNEHRAVSRAVANMFFDEEEPVDVPLYYVVHPDRARESDLRIQAEELESLGGRDYSKIATEAFVLHESQFGPMGTAGSVAVAKQFQHYGDTVILRPVRSEAQ